MYLGTSFSWRKQKNLSLEQGSMARGRGKTTDIPYDFVTVKCLLMSVHWLQPLYFLWWNCHSFVEHCDRRWGQKECKREQVYFVPFQYGSWLSALIHWWMEWLHPTLPDVYVGASVFWIFPVRPADRWWKVSLWDILFRVLFKPMRREAAFIL